MIVAALQVTTPTNHASLVALNRLLGKALAQDAELIALALKPLPARAPRPADPLAEQLGQLAYGHGVALCAGPFVEREDEKRFISYGLWNGEGLLIGIQSQVNLPAASENWSSGAVAGPLTLTARDGEDWRVGIIGDADINSPALHRALAQSGAELLIHLGAMPASFDPLAQDQLLLSATALYHVCGLESFALGPNLAGQARVVAGANILAATTSPAKPDLAVGSISKNLIFATKST